MPYDRNQRKITKQPNGMNQRLILEVDGAKIEVILSQKFPTKWLKRKLYTNRNSINTVKSEAHKNR